MIYPDRSVRGTAKDQKPKRQPRPAVTGGCRPKGTSSGYSHDSSDHRGFNAPHGVSEPFKYPAIRAIYNPGNSIRKSAAYSPGCCEITPAAFSGNDLFRKVFGLTALSLISCRDFRPGAVRGEAVRLRAGTFVPNGNGRHAVGGGGRADVP